MKYNWIKYYVDEENRVVVAVMDKTECDALYLIYRRLIVPSAESDEYKIKSRYVAKARCHRDDEFDVELGKEIARKRVLFKYYEDLTKVLQKFRVDMIKSLDLICAKPFAHFDHITAERIEIEEKIK